MRSLMIVLLGLVAVGCVTRVGDLTLVSNRNLGMIPEPLKRGVEGRHCQILWQASSQPNLEEAIDRAQRQVPEGNALANVALYYEAYTYILIRRACFKVIGDVVRLPNPGDLADR